MFSHCKTTPSAPYLHQPPTPQLKLYIQTHYSDSKRARTKILHMRENVNVQTRQATHTQKKRNEEEVCVHIENVYFSNTHECEYIFSFSLFLTLHGNTVDNDYHTYSQAYTTHTTKKHTNIGQKVLRLTNYSYISYDKNLLRYATYLKTDFIRCASEVRLCDRQHQEFDAAMQIFF